MILRALVLCTALRFLRWGLACEAWRAELWRRQREEHGEANFEAFDADARGDQVHKAFLKVEGRHMVVVVGLGAVTGNAVDPVHPMGYLDDPLLLHWVDTVWIEDEAGKILCMRRLDPDETEPAMLVCSVPHGTATVTGFVHCNIHGMFRGQTVRLDPMQAVQGLQPSCSLASCAQFTDENCSAKRWSYVQSQNASASSSSSSSALSLEHKPTLTLHGNGSAGVVVGEKLVNGSVLLHPMIASSDPDDIHWITVVWIEDAAGNIVSGREFLPAEGGLPMHSFLIPSGTTKMTPFARCNKHGVFRGDQISVPHGQASAVSEPSCQRTYCPKVEVRFAVELDCESFKADSHRWHEALGFTPPYHAVTSDGQNSFEDMHKPRIEMNGTRGLVVVGRNAGNAVDSDAVHPMNDHPDSLHFIQTLWVEDQLGRLLSLRHLSPAEPAPATMYFDVPEGTTSVTAYASCNLHGLWKGETMSVTETMLGALVGCSVQQCLEGSSVSACQAFTAELRRRQEVPRYDPTGLSPSLALDGSSATIVVRNGNESQNQLPLTASGTKDIVHWVSHVYALDDLGNLVALCELLPTDPSPGPCAFEVPDGIVFLRPYAYSNQLGLYIGDVVQVSVTNSSASRQCFKRECSASQPSLASSPIRSEAIDEMMRDQQVATDRINSGNMCLQHTAVYYVARSLVPQALQEDIDLLTRPGSAPSDIAMRFDIFSGLFGKLNALGGRWSAHELVFEHTLQDANGSQPVLRTGLINEALTGFTQETVRRGQAVYADGVLSPIVDFSQELLLINATFAMDWGYGNFKSLGPHYTIFYTPEFLQEYVNVMLCAKTRGWMGIGWLNPSHDEASLMVRTDMVVAFVEDGQAVVQDRFAFSIEEPTKDEMLADQRPDDAGNLLNGRNDLKLIPGSLGLPGLEWCSDATCSLGFSLVQFQRAFATEDAYDIRLPAKSAKLGLIYAWGSRDPFATYMEQHGGGDRGYVELQWNLDCAPGTFFDIASADCKPCDKGFFRPASAPVHTCLRAPPGTFQNETGQAVAKTCKDGFTTTSAGSTDEFACVCPGPSLSLPNGKYHVDTCDGEAKKDIFGVPMPCARLGRCLACPEGMICRGARDIIFKNTPLTSLDTRARRLQDDAMQRVADFCSSFALTSLEECTSRTYCDVNIEDLDCVHAPPELKPGYWSDPGKPLSVFKCIDTLQCRGGWPGHVCASGRQDIACGRCEANHFPGKLGSCQQCSGDDTVPGLLATVALAFLTLSFAAYMRLAFVRSSRATISMMLIVSQAGVLVQTLGVFRDLSLMWEEPVRSVLSLMQLVNFDLRSLRIACYVATDDPFMLMIAKMLFIPFLASCGGFLGAAAAACKRERFSWSSYLNALGLVVMVLYLTICMSMTQPIHCTSNPNGLPTMVTDPAIVCWGPEHIPLALCSLLGLGVYGAGFLAYIVQIVLRYPALVNRGSGLKLLTKYRFLFHRFKDSAYYWGPIFLLQKLAAALVPIVFANAAAVQILTLSVLLTVYLSMTSNVLPWATNVACLGDIFLNMGLLVFLTVSAFLVETATPETRGLLTLFLVALLVLIGFGLCLLAGFSLYRRLCPGRTYDAFLCHHKAGAGVLCRWIKSEIHRQAHKAKIFLDSDELEGLADIGDIVKHQTRTLIVVATKLTLTRPWCAVEVTTAMRNSVGVVLVKCSDFGFYDVDGFASLRAGWSPSDIMIFAQSALDPDLVEESYRALEKVPLVEYDAFAPHRTQTALVSSLLESVKIQRSFVEKTLSTEAEDPDAEILVVGCMGSSEGRVACQVMRDLVMERTRKNVLVVYNKADAVKAARTAHCILVVLMAGILRDDKFLAILEAVDKAYSDDRLEIVSALADAQFEFPSADYYQEISKRGEHLVRSVKRLVNILALPFSPLTSIKVLRAQVDEICRRFRFIEDDRRRAPRVAEIEVRSASVASSLTFQAQDPDGCASHLAASRSHVSMGQPYMTASPLSRGLSKLDSRMWQERM